MQARYFDRVGWTLAEAKRRHMRVWIFDDLNWPSGTANGFVVKDHPEYRSKMIEGKKQELKPGEWYCGHVSGEPICTCIRMSSGGRWRKVKLEGQMWRNTTGKTFELFSAYHLIYNYEVMCLDGAQNSKGYRGYCDLMNPAAVKCWMGYICPSASFVNPCCSRNLKNKQARPRQILWGASGVQTCFEV